LPRQGWGVAEHGRSKIAKPDQSFVSALVKAFQWQDLVDQGVYTSPKELAEKENIEVTHVYRLMRLTMLAPDIIEAVLWTVLNPAR
jgi:hypothetical protein